jgi:hypothetical protein
MPRSAGAVSSQSDDVTYLVAIEYRVSDYVELLRQGQELELHDLVQTGFDDQPLVRTD